MAATFKRGMGKLGMKTGELLGLDSNSKTEVSEEFRDLQIEVENRQTGTENIQAALLLYTNHLLKKRDSTDSSKQKLYLLENLGSSMFRLGASLPADSNFGKALEQFGQVVERISDLQVQFINNVKDEWLSNLQRNIDEFKEYQTMKKRLDTRRSDYESKQTKLQKSRKENVNLEDDLRTAQVRYEDTFEDVTRRMVELKDADHSNLVELYGFYEAQVAYHKKCGEQLDRMRAVFEETLKAKRAPAKAIPSLGSRRSEMTLKGSNDASGPARGPIPFNGSQAALQNLSRSSSARDPHAHRRNGSTQYSDNADDQSYGSISPFEGGHNEVSSRQTPPFNRVQSENNASMRKAVPTVAPRRHAPAPPAPARAPARVLRRAIYKFNADEIGELPIDKGDIVEVTEHVDDGWWYGKLVYSASGGRADGQDAKAGLFPSNYTEDCTEADVPPALAARTPAHRSNTTPEGSRVSPTRPHQRTGSHVQAPSHSAAAAAASVGACGCGCTEYAQNAFRKGSKECTNCYHIH